MAFIVIIVVMAVLIFFIETVLKKMSQQVGGQIDKDVNKLINTYDFLLEEKSQELARVKEELEAAIEKRNTLKKSMYDDDFDFDFDDSKEGIGSPVIVQAGNYIDDTFFEKYNLIRTQFHDLAREGMEEVVLKLGKKRRNINVHEYKELLGIFDFNLQYQMDTLDSAGQLEVMNIISNHSVGKKRVLERYVKEHGDFSFEAFMDYLRNYIFFNDNVVYVISRDGTPAIADSPGNIVYKKDPTIGEGYVVSYRGQYYDFSLKGGANE